MVIFKLKSEIITTLCDENNMYIMWSSFIVGCFVTLVITFSIVLYLSSKNRIFIKKNTSIGGK